MGDMSEQTLKDWHYNTTNQCPESDCQDSDKRGYSPKREGEVPRGTDRLYVVTGLMTGWVTE